MTRTLLKAIPLALLLILPTASRLKAGDDPPGEKEKRFVVHDEDSFFDFEGDEPFAFHFGEASRARIGVRLIQITPELRQHFGAPREAGVLVAGVEPDSPAAKAGIKDGDIITKIEDQAIDTDHPLDAVLSQFAPGQTVKVTILRDGNQQTVNVTLGTRPKDLG